MGPTIRSGEGEKLFSPSLVNYLPSLEMADSVTFSTEHLPDMPWLFWQVVKINDNAIGHIARNNHTDKNYYLCSYCKDDKNRTCQEFSGYYESIIDAQNKAREYAASL
jgi:hypothetical protein